MTKKISLALGAAALLTAGAVAASIHAQKRADTHGAHQGAKAGDAAKAHADCPLMGDGKAGAKAEAGGGAGPAPAVHAGHGRAGHDEHLAAVNARGEGAMGFSQTETTHHFILTREGGLIQVEANDPGDVANRDRVRRHLAEVSAMFAAGDFRTPLLVHARTPPGADAMGRLKSEVGYAFEETAGGGRVRITAKSPEALAAVHEFLRFQIEDHRTGDPTEVEDR